MTEFLATMARVHPDQLQDALEAYRRAGAPEEWLAEGAKRFPVASRSGLGDLVAAVAQPVARLIDAVAGTNLKGCGGCAKRRQKLNQVGRLLT